MCRCLFLNLDNVFVITMDTGIPVKDQFISNGLKWIVHGSFRGTDGFWELVVDLDTNTVIHLLFKGGSK